MRWYDVRWCIKALGRYADFRGRSRRAEYWVFTLISGIVGVALTFVDGALGYGTETTLPVPVGGQGPVGWLYGLAMLIPTVAVGTRRLHDIGRSGWWQLLAVPAVIGTLPWHESMLTTILMVIMSITGTLGGIVLLIMFVSDGTPEANTWGVNPKADSVGARNPSGGADDDSAGD